MESEPELTIADKPERSRYEALLGGRPVAYSTYELEPGRIVVTHTVVKPEMEGRGIGSRLAAFLVKDALSRGLRITPICPFTRAYLRRHPEHDASVDYPTRD